MKSSFISVALFAWAMLVTSFNIAESTTTVAQDATKSSEEFIKTDKTNETTTSSTEASSTQPVEPNKSESTEEKIEQSNVDAMEEEQNSATVNATGAMESTTENDNTSNSQQSKQEQQSPPAVDDQVETKEISQVGPFIELFGQKLLKLQRVGERSFEVLTLPTNEALHGKQVVGVYFSADWCGPCRKFTPELVSFYDKMNSRMGRKDQFEIVWVSRCRDRNSFDQYFTHMNWLALPVEEALGNRGKKLSEMYKVKSIPTLVLLDEVGNVITTDARNKIPQDKAGIGFPWRNPIATLYVTILPRSLRLMIKSHIFDLKERLIQRIKTLLALKPALVNR